MEGLMPKNSPMEDLSTEDLSIEDLPHTYTRYQLSLCPASA
jgi:hypothetical protein